MSVVSLGFMEHISGLCNYSRKLGNSKIRLGNCVTVYIVVSLSMVRVSSLINPQVDHSPTLNCTVNLFT